MKHTRLSRTVTSTVLFIVLSLGVYGQNQFNLPNDGNWYLVAQAGGRHGYFEYNYSHNAPHNPSLATGTIQFINAKTNATQYHQTMGYTAHNQPQFALLNLGNTSQIWVRATGGANTGVFRITQSAHASILNGVTSDSNLEDNGGTVAYFDKLPDNAHVMEGSAYVKSGNLGVGTQETKGYRLAVNGNIRAKEVKVETANWPDYVFGEDYELPDIRALASYIKSHKHLPGVPTAAEVEAEGIDLGEMNRILLEKLEELTLLLIEKSAGMERQESEKNELKTQMSAVMGALKQF